MPELVPLYYYIYGTQVDHLDPPLAFLADDDWVPPLHEWIVDHYPDATWYCITDGEGNDAMLKSIWIGTEPPDDKMEPGDVIRVIKVGVKGA